MAKSKAAKKPAAKKPAAKKPTAKAGTKPAAKKPATKSVSKKAPAKKVASKATAKPAVKSAAKATPKRTSTKAAPKKTPAKTTPKKAAAKAASKAAPKKPVAKAAPKATPKKPAAKSAPKSTAKAAPKKAAAKSPAGRPAPKVDPSTLDHIDPKMLSQIISKLEEMREESRGIVNQHLQTDLKPREESNDVGDDLDQASNERDREFGLIMHQRHLRRLQQIDEAFERIDDGSYGLCEGTDEPINPRRLMIMPLARYSLEYQEQQEKMLGRMMDSSGFAEGDDSFASDD